MRAPESIPESAEDSESWRDQLASRLTRVFAVLFALSTLIAATMLQGRSERSTLVMMGSVATLLVAIPALTGLPRGRPRAWLIVAPGVLSGLLAFARLGYLAGPAMVLAMTLMLAGLLLGRRAMLVLAGLSCLALCIIAWAMVHGRLPAPDPKDVSMTRATPWIRSILVTFLALGMFGGLTLTVVARVERSLELARAETRRRELAERARAEAELGALEARQLETVGRLAAGVAHDFNNNLTAILGCAELLALELPADSSAQELVSAITQSSQRAAELTRQLLVYSRKAQMLLVPTNLHRLLEEAVVLVRRSGDLRAEVVLELATEPVTISADATLLQNAIVNLLLNGSDAMPHGGRLTVATTTCDATPAPGAPAGPCVLVEILDTGVGIPKEVLPHIFEPFFTTKPVGRGSGLGLAAVAGAIKAHGGTITVETEVLVGTAFRILLPRTTAEGEVSVAHDTGLLRGSGELLVVDDEPAVRNTVVTALRSLGYTVTPFADAESAIEAIRNAPSRYDLVLLDLRMPHMSGETAFAKLQALAPTLPVLIWSGHGAEQDVEALLQRGAVGFVQKPYRMAELSRVIARSKRRTAPDRGLKVS
jgi:signal transduction histidine kinase/ActR/RegA family two-component response regulator